MYTITAITVLGPTWDLEAPPNTILDYTQPPPDETSRPEWFQPQWDKPEDIPPVSEFPAVRTYSGQYTKTFFRVVKVPPFTTFLDRLPTDTDVTFNVCEPSEYDDDGFDVETTVSDYRKDLKELYLQKIAEHNSAINPYRSTSFPLYVSLSALGNRFVQIFLEHRKEPLSDSYTFGANPMSYTIIPQQFVGDVIARHRIVADNVELLLRPLLESAT